MRRATIDLIILNKMRKEFLPWWSFPVTHLCRWSMYKDNLKKKTPKPTVITILHVIDYKLTRDSSNSVLDEKKKTKLLSSIESSRCKKKKPTAGQIHQTPTASAKMKPVASCQSRLISSSSLWASWPAGGKGCRSCCPHWPLRERPHWEAVWSSPSQLQDHPGGQNGCTWTKNNTKCRYWKCS